MPTPKIEKLQQKINELQEELKREQRREREEERKRDTRKKILLGVVLEKLVADKTISEKQLTAALEKYLTKDSERELFNLSSVTTNDNAKTETPKEPAADKPVATKPSSEEEKPSEQAPALETTTTPAPKARKQSRKNTLEEEFLEN